jgi:Phage integrase family
LLAPPLASTKRIIILGGGFGGVKCAETLCDPARVGARGTLPCGHRLRAFAPGQACAAAARRSWPAFGKYSHRPNSRSGGDGHDEPIKGNVKGGSFRDLPLTTELSDSLGGWFAFLESVKGVRLRRGGGVNFAGSALVFPGRDGAPFSNQAFNARIKLDCQRARVPVISAHPLRHTAATLLLNERGANPRAVLRKTRVVSWRRSCSTSAEPPARRAGTPGTQERGNNGALYSLDSEHPRWQSPTPLIRRYFP